MRKENIQMLPTNAKTVSLLVSTAKTKTTVSPASPTLFSTTKTVSAPALPLCTTTVQANVDHVHPLVTNVSHKHNVPLA